MAIIALKAWYLERYEPLKEVVQRPPDLRLNRNSLLKSGLRADFLNESLAIQESAWFERYLAGEPVSFYIEGSGSYQIANLDLVSQEIYFTKQDAFSHLQAVIILAGQSQFPDSTQAIATTVQETLSPWNRNATTPIDLQTLTQSPEAPLRLTDSQLRAIRYCLLLLVDMTPVAVNAASSPSAILYDPLVCAQLGYGLHCKKPGQIILLQQERPEMSGTIPFDVANYHQLSFPDPATLAQTLPAIMKSALHPFNLHR